MATFTRLRKSELEVEDGALAIILYNCHLANRRDLANLRSRDGESGLLPTRSKTPNSTRMDDLLWMGIWQVRRSFKTKRVVTTLR